MWRVLILTAGATLTGCAVHQGGDQPRASDPFSSDKPADYAKSTANDPRDPFEPVNRASWVLNYDILEPYAVRPVVHTYADYVADPLKEGVQNMMLNLEEPASFVNHLVSGDIPGAGTNLARFGLNSTVGVLGFFDVAEKLSLTSRPKDFSQVMGQIGVGDGPYLMVPFMGPTTLRQLSGDVVDSLYFPYDVMTIAMRAGKWVLMGLYDRSQLIDQEAIIDNALDPYGLTKDFYLQYQASRVGREVGAMADDDLSDFMDEIDSL
ncbi:VacJ family lipoprotein [Zobellella sp. DQSA1]|uniref:MlaA family lipoprotein n=1 Tax=Zobellella sp. DQSA1 TaxID=3342386 RepID=UPI0035C04D52